MGPPSVRPWRTPDVTSAESFSIFMRPPRPWPSWRRAMSRLTASRSSSRPAGRPSTTQVRPGPWDSPAVTTRIEDIQAASLRPAPPSAGGGEARRAARGLGGRRLRDDLQGTGRLAVAEAPDPAHQGAELLAPVGCDRLARRLGGLGV